MAALMPSTALVAMLFAGTFTYPSVRVRRRSGDGVSKGIIASRLRFCSQCDGHVSFRGLCCYFRATYLRAHIPYRKAMSIG